jgi:hypothetical protein
MWLAVLQVKLARDYRRLGGRRRNEFHADSATTLTKRLNEAVMRVYRSRDSMVRRITLSFLSCTCSKNISTFCHSVKEPFGSPDWAFEARLDGYCVNSGFRCHMRIQPGQWYAKA